MVFKGKEITFDSDGYIFVNGMHLKYQGYKVYKGNYGYYNEYDAEIKDLSDKSLEEVLNLCIKGKSAISLAFLLSLKNTGKIIKTIYNQFIKSFYEPGNSIKIRGFQKKS